MEANSNSRVCSATAFDDFYERLRPHKHLVMFIQEVVCFKRPVYAAVYVIILHSIWSYFAFTTQTPLTMLLTLALFILTGDLVIRVVRAKFGAHLPDLLAQSVLSVTQPTSNATSPRSDPPNTPNLTATPSATDAPVSSPFVPQPVRSFSRLCTLLADTRSWWRGVKRAYHDMKAAEFGKATVLATTSTLILAVVISFVQEWVLLYLLLLTFIAIPPLERIPFFGNILYKASIYLRIVFNGIYHFSHVASENLAIEPLTAAEMRDLEEREAAAMREAMRRHRQSRMLDNIDDSFDTYPQPPNYSPVNSTTTQNNSKAKSNDNSDSYISYSSRENSDYGFEILDKDDL